MAVKKWVSRITTIILVILFLFALFLAVSSKFNGGKARLFGNELLTVLSGSMEPEIQTGSIIAVKPIDDPTALQIGDVITFKSSDNPNVLITHRIIDMAGSGENLNFITKGDNNDYPDTSPILASNVVAKYTNFTIPYIGYFLSFAGSKLGIILLLVVPGVLLIVYQLFDFWKTITRLEKNSQLAKEPTINEIPEQS